MTQAYFDHGMNKRMALSMLRKFIALVGVSFTPYYWAIAFVSVRKSCPVASKYMGGDCSIITSVPFAASMAMYALIFGIGVALWRRLDDRLRSNMTM
jgi:hypothetical protein